MIQDQHSFQANEQGHLEIGGLDTVDLAKKYGTPLYVYDVSVIRKNCRDFVDTFKSLGVKAQVAYASKAFSTVAMLQVINEEKMSLDVVSEGELYTALQADFPAEKIHLHGNNKSLQVLNMAIENNIGCIVIDNFYEIELLNKLLKKHDTTIDVLIRVTPGIESDTHRYIMTGNEDSKFGFNMSNGQAEKAFQLLHNHKYIRLKGMHSHLGSQLFETDQYLKATDMLFEWIVRWYKLYDYIPEVLNLGGGFGIRYTRDDSPLPLDVYVKKIVETVQAHVKKSGIPMPEIWLEPGRAIAGSAGITLYEVGSMKSIPELRDYISVDGGMSDNLRPALYNAKYEAVLANKALEKSSRKVSVAGKCCESGDMLLWDLPVPPVEHGDILAVFSTGAYGYSMANHYNRIPKAAVVFVENGHDQLVVQRESYKDLVKYDLPYVQPSKIV